MLNAYPNDNLINEATLAVREFFGLPDTLISPLDGGRVNESFLITSRGRCYVLQKLNDFFLGNHAFGLNWQMVYQSISERSGRSYPPMPPIFPDLWGRYLASGPQVTGYWRLTGYQAGRPALNSAEHARLAARILGFFHRHLNQPRPVKLEPLPKGEFTNQFLSRPDDFEKLADHFRGHRHLDELKPLIEKCARAARQLPTRPDFISVFNLKNTVIHGDPKMDNFLINPEDESGTLLDWDSVSYGHPLIDLAEMLRSWGWSRTAGVSVLNFDNLTGVIKGYSETGLTPGPSELELLPPILRAIALNLSRRYLNDALAEVYFKWDCRLYPSLYKQNLTRAGSMLRLAEKLLRREMELTDVLTAAGRSGRGDEHS